MVLIDWWALFILCKERLVMLHFLQVLKYNVLIALIDLLIDRFTTLDITEILFCLVGNRVSTDGYRPNTRILSSAY